MGNKFLDATGVGKLWEKTKEYISNAVSNAGSSILHYEDIWLEVDMDIYPFYKTPISSDNLKIARLSKITFTYDKNIDLGTYEMWGLKDNDPTIAVLIFKLDDSTVRQINSIINENTKPVDGIYLESIEIHFGDEFISVFVGNKEFTVDYAEGQSLLIDFKDYSHINFDCYCCEAEPRICILKISS